MTGTSYLITDEQYVRHAFEGYWIIYSQCNLL